MSRNENVMLPKGGYWGKIVWVDLTSEKTKLQVFDEQFARKYLGGVGFGIKIVADNVTRSVEPLSPLNVLVFATGPYNAAVMAGASRCVACARSPLTGYWGESNAGGNIAVEIKRAGFDAIVFVGRAKKPVYVWIHDDEVEIKDADGLWGKGTLETTDILRREVGDYKASVAAIGQAGENLVKYACIICDKHAAFGRTGMGAVMGSKNLKALVVRGTKEPPIADPTGFEEVYREVREKIMRADFTKQNREHGQPMAVVPREENGLLPIKNWAQDRWQEGAKKIGTPRYTEELKVKPISCAYCVMGCHRGITNPEYRTETTGPEYETLAMIGANLLIDNLKTIVEANYMCNNYGIDTIELGGILAYAFECYENGLISKEDTDGIELRWGCGETLLTMIEKIAKRDGFGNLLAEGIRPCVERIGAESKSYAVEVMGMVTAAHDPRAFFGETITTIASTRGSCHIHGFAEAIELGFCLPELGLDKPMDRFEWRRKGYVGAIYQDIQQFWNSLGWCFFYFFSNVSLTDQVKLLNAITGWDVNPKEALKIGERIVCMQHCFNLRMGLRPEKENVMPERLTTPHKDGGAAGKTPPWQIILKEYWKTKDWINGIPTRRKLIELGLEEFANELYGY
jgi:aldehyde:ferredoxin oxidoreductase